MLTADCPVQLLTFQTGCTYHALWGCPFIKQQMLPVRSSPILSPPWLFSYFCLSAKGTAGEDDIHVIVHNEGSFVSGLFAHYLLCLQLLQLLSSGGSSQRRFCAPCHLSALKHDTKNIRQDMISGLTRRQLTLCFVNQNTLGLITSFCSLQWQVAQGIFFVLFFNISGLFCQNISSLVLLCNKVKHSVTIFQRPTVITQATDSSYLISSY